MPKQIIFLIFLCIFMQTKSMEECPDIITIAIEEIKNKISQEFKLTSAQCYSLNYILSSRERLALAQALHSAKRLGKTPTQVINEFCEKKLKSLRIVLNKS